MQVRTWIVVLCWVAVAGGCTMGLGETTRFATRNLSVEGVLADGAFSITEGDVAVVPSGLEPELGVVIFFQARDDTRTIETELTIEGNLGALCPGASVELAAEGDRLVAVGVDGAPAMVVAPLMGLELTMTTNATGPGDREQLVAERVVMSSREGEDGFARMDFEGTTVVDGERRVITGSFELARIVEDTEVPDWDGSSWNGEPIEPWE